jgi:aspartate dehydrogenase
VKSSNRLRVGILGVGSIGRTLATALDAKRIDAELVAITDQDSERAEALAAELASRPRVVSLHELIQRADLVVEAASQCALLDFVPRALAAGRDMLIMSVGGLLGHEEWFRQASEKNCRIYVPSGAIAGLDGIKSASMGYVQSAVLTSRKPIAALRGTKYVVDHNIPLESFQEETLIFEGSAEEAARAFPTTSNVAASLRLAISCTVPVLVRVVAVPGGSKNVHEIRVQGEFGRLSVDVENEPSKANPRTSQLAAFSALATLTNLTRSLRVGT